MFKSLDDWLDYQVSQENFQLDPDCTRTLKHLTYDFAITWLGGGDYISNIDIATATLNDIVVELNYDLKSKMFELLRKLRTESFKLKKEAEESQCNKTINDFMSLINSNSHTAIK